MPFDLLGWAVGFGLSSAARAVSQKFFGRELEDRIDMIAREWAKDHEVSPAAMFRASATEPELARRPALRDLRAALGNAQVPCASQWESALMEQWDSVRVELGPSAALFFRQPEERARSAIRELAATIARQCEQDEVLFRSTVLRLLHTLSSALSVSDGRVVRPFAWVTSPDVKTLALALQEALNARVELVAIDEEAATVHIWADLPAGSVQARNDAFLTLATVASGVAGIRWVQIGIASTKPIRRTNARGPVGQAMIRFEAPQVLSNALDRSGRSDVWNNVALLVLQHDNIYAQRWQRCPFRRFDDWSDEQVQSPPASFGMSFDAPGIAVELEFVLDDGERLLVPGDRVAVHDFTLSEIGTAYFIATLTPPASSAARIQVGATFCVWRVCDGARLDPIWLSVSGIRPKVHKGGGVTLRIHGRGALATLIDASWRDVVQDDLTKIISKACAACRFELRGFAGRPIQLHVDARSRYGALRMLAVSLGFVINEDERTNTVVFRTIEHATREHAAKLTEPMPSFTDDDDIEVEWEVGTLAQDRDTE